MKKKETKFSLPVPNLLAWAAIIVLFVWFLRAVEPILLPFIIGTLVAYLFDPLADRLEKRRVSRGYASAVITLAFFSILIALVVWIGPLLYHQLASLITQLPDFLKEVEMLFEEKAAPLFSSIDRLTNGHTPESIPATPSDFMARAVALGNEVVGKLVSSSFALLNVASLLLITPIVSFYLLRDWDCVVKRVDTLLPRAHAATIRAQANEVSRVLAGYLRGQLYVMFILTVLYAIAFAVIGLKYALLLGVLAGMLVIIPYIGTWISAGLGLMVAYSQFGITPDFWIVAAVFAVGQVLESQILTPKIIGDRVGVHPLWLLFGMLAGAVLIGFAGVLLAVPITAVISVGVRFLISIYLESPLYQEK